MTASRSHSEIITASIGDDTATALAAKLGGGITRQNVVDWRIRNSIPAERWKRFVDLGLCSYGELADAAAAPERAA